jgi:surface protein
LNFEQWQGGELPETEDLAVLKTHAQLEGTAFLTAPYYSEIDNCSWIRNITFEDSINIPEDAIESWDIGVSENENVIAYVVASDDLISRNESSSLMLARDPTVMYDLVIQSNFQLYANLNMQDWFSTFLLARTIKNLDYLDTSSVNNMKNMFFMFGRGVDDLNLNLSDLDTSNVTDMTGMFMSTGRNSLEFVLDLSNFDTSNVTNMSEMFWFTGEHGVNFTLDISNFDTRNVTNMSHMFYYAGYSGTNFTLDVSDFDTRNVTDMSNMFARTGYNSTNFTLDVSNFDTSNVTYISYMFDQTGYNSINFNTSITIRNPNISSYGNMFRDVATKGDSKITINYVGKTSELVDKMIATKSDDSNVVKGALVS